MFKCFVRCYEWLLHSFRIAIAAQLEHAYCLDIPWSLYDFPAVVVCFCIKCLVPALHMHVFVWLLYGVYRILLWLLDGFG